MTFRTYRVFVLFSTISPQENTKSVKEEEEGEKKAIYLIVRVEKIIPVIESNIVIIYDRFKLLRTGCT